MKLIRYIVMIAVAASTYSCVKDTTSSDSVGSAIAFEVSIAEQQQTKANIVTPINQAQTLSNFGVYAIEQTDELDYTDLSQYLMDCDEVIYNTEFGKWHYNDNAHWPIDNNFVEFIAYAPYSHNGFNTTVNELGQLVINYHSYPTKIEEQTDLMVADRLLQADNSSNVNLHFAHTLAAIAFKFEGDTGVTINSIGFRGGYTSGVLTADSNGFEWSEQTFDATSLFAVSFKEGYNQISESEDLSTAQSGDYILMLPFENVNSLKIEISYTTTTNTEYTASIYPKDDVDWEAGNIYLYTIDVEDDAVDDSLGDIKFGTSLEIEPWVVGNGGEECELFSTNDPSMLDNRSELSNCYMIDSEAKYSTYYIPVDERIYEFWGGYQGLTDNALTDYTLSKEDDWYVDIIWYMGDLMKLDANVEDIKDESDETLYTYSSAIGQNSADQDPLSFEEFMSFSRLDPNSDEYDKLPRNVMVNAESCTNNYVTQNAQAIMKITIDWDKAPDVVNGNIFVALKKRISGSSVLLWSWHFWVTDYNPNITPTSTDIEGNYMVQNGNVHQYKDSDTQQTPIWSFGGIYSDKYMMDRNLGMHSPKVDSDSPYKDIIYYQYGRKEPFAYSGSTTSISDYYAVGSSYSSISRVSSYTKKSMQTAIQAPTSRYNYTNSSSSATYTTWLADDVVSNTAVAWNDVDVPYKNANYSLYVSRKSLFDPSPLGWMIPIYDAWNIFTSTKYYLTDEDIDVEATVGITFFDYIYFPYTGYYNYYYTSSSGTTTYQSNTTNVSLWSANPYNSTSGRRLGLLNGTSYITNPNTSSSYGYKYHTAAMPIRCIQE